MVTILLTALRYVFLLLLILSIIKLIKFMAADLKAAASGHNAESRPEPSGKSPNPPATTGRVALTVVESSVSSLKPGDTLGFDEEAVIGRGERSDIVIDGSFASARHARIYFKEGQYWLDDLASTNGTFLNGTQVKQPIVLADGDRIKIGGVIFQFVRWGYEVGADH